MSSHNAIHTFVKTLSDAGWSIDNSENWLEDFKNDIPISCYIETPKNILFLTHPPMPNHISLLIDDKNILEYWEVGMDYSDVTGLRSVLLEVVNHQNSIDLQTFPELVSNLRNVCTRIVWEEQGFELEEIDEENVTSARYRYPRLKKKT